MTVLKTSRVGHAGPQPSPVTIEIDGALRSGMRATRSFLPVERELAAALDEGAQIIARGDDIDASVSVVALALPGLIREEIRREITALGGERLTSRQKTKAEERIRRRPSVLAMSEGGANPCTGFLIWRFTDGHPTPTLTPFWRNWNGAYEMTPLSAAEQGHASVFEAMQSRQPAVVAEIMRRHAELQKQLSAGTMILTSDAGLHDWRAGGLMSVFLHPEFSTAHADDHPRLAAEMRPRFAVHGEFAAGDLYSLHLVERVRKVIRLMERFPEVWGVEHAPLSEKLETFRRYSLLLRDVSFEEALSIEHDGYRPGDDLVGAYHDETLSRLGIVHSASEWIARERGWQAGPDVTILVTKSTKR